MKLQVKCEAFSADFLHKGKVFTQDEIIEVDDVVAKKLLIEYKECFNEVQVKVKNNKEQ